MITMKRISASIVSASVLFFITSVAGRGRLLDPPNRSSLWREGYPQPINRNDSDLNCGGDQLPFLPFYIEGGWCGLCGDAIFEPQRHELGGLYVPKYTVTRRYTSRSKHIKIKVLVQELLGGFFEFSLCAQDDEPERVTQECFNENRLRIARYGTKYYPRRTGVHRLKLVIPAGLRCQHCVLQWRWITEKFTRGKCDSFPFPRTCLLPWRYQNCADISISSRRKSEEYREMLEEIISDLDSDQFWVLPFLSNPSMLPFISEFLDM